MAEYIEREALLADFEKRYKDYRQRSEKNIGFGCVEVDGILQTAAVVVKSCLDTVQQARAADVAPVVHGRWEEKSWWEKKSGKANRYTVKECSVCGCHTKPRYEYHYCPNCGARMDGDGK